MESSNLALRMASSGNQEANHDLVSHIFRTMGLKTKSHNLLHHYHGHTRPSVAITLEHPHDRKSSLYAAASYGLMSNQPGQIVFHPAAHGKDWLHHMRFEGDADGVANAIRGVGINQFHLVPMIVPSGGPQFRAIIFDQGGSLLPKLRNLAGKVGGEIYTQRGTGFKIGGKDTSESRQQYRNIIRKIEGNNSPKDENGLPRDSMAAKYARKLVNKAMSRKRSSIRKYAADPEIRRGLMRTIRENPGDPTPRAVLADHLEEEGMHHDENTLHALRSGHPVIIQRHRGTGKTRAIIGLRARDMSEQGRMLAAAALKSDTKELGDRDAFDDDDHGNVRITRDARRLISMIHPTSLLHIQHEWNRFINGIPHFIKMDMDHDGTDKDWNNYKEADLAQSIWPVISKKEEVVLPRVFYPYEEYYPRDVMKYIKNARNALLKHLNGMVNDKGGLKLNPSTGDYHYRSNSPALANAVHIDEIPKPELPPNPTETLDNPDDQYEFPEKMSRRGRPSRYAAFAPTSGPNQAKQLIVNLPQQLPSGSNPIQASASPSAASTVNPLQDYPQAPVKAMPGNHSTILPYYVEGNNVQQ